MEIIGNEVHLTERERALSGFDSPFELSYESACQMLQDIGTERRDIDEYLASVDELDKNSQIGMMEQFKKYTEMMIIFHGVKHGLSVRSSERSQLENLETADEFLQITARKS